MTSWLPVRRILRQAFGAGNVRILRTGVIEVRQADQWSIWGSLVDAGTLQRLRDMA